MNSKNYLTFAASFSSIVLFCTTPAFGAHPLITDDTTTQGKGKTLIEMSYQYESDNDDGIKSETSRPQIQLIYGILDPLDVIVTVPYLFVRQTQGDITTNNDGVGDISLALKWRFYGEKEKGLQFAIKPSITLPTGNEQMGLGSGQASAGIPFITNFDRQSYGITFLSSFEREEWITTLSLGYQNNQYGLQSDRDTYRQDMWLAGLSGQYEIIEKVWLVGEVVVQSNPYAASSTPPAFINGGVIYELTKSIDLDVGYKYGLNKPAADYAISGAVTVRF
jgi:hypothetical protein